MNQLISTTNNNVATIDSREVAEMLGKEHSYVLEMIQGRTGKLGIIPVLTNANLAVVNYFIESFYIDRKGEKRKCYLVTKMGCELLGNKQQGEKGILFTAKYVERFNKMEQSLKNQVSQLSEKQKCILAIYDGGQGAIQGAKRLSEIEVAEAVAPLEAKIEEQKPLVTFAEQVGNSCDLISVRELAKLANDENLDIGEKRLFQWLRENSYLSKKKVNGQFTNEPYQRFVQQGLFKVIEQTYTTPFGKRLNKKTMVTGKGQIYLINKLKDDGRFIHGFGDMLLSS